MQKCIQCVNVLEQVLDVRSCSREVFSSMICSVESCMMVSSKRSCVRETIKLRTNMNIQFFTMDMEQARFGRVEEFITMPFLDWFVFGLRLGGHPALVPKRI